MPDGRLNVLAGVGHYPHMEAPDTMIDIIDRFVRSTVAAV
jgi:pimeloyl-ACP methyl ester carboxylesterase